MEKFLLILISITASSVNASERKYCKQDNTGGFNLCGSSKVLSFVNRTKDSRYLALNLSDISSIAPKTFQGLTLYGLQLSGSPERSVCNPKAIELTPESFNGLTLLYRLELKCVKFSVKPNPFRNLKSLMNLWLKEVEFTRFPQEIFVDFPYLNGVKLIDLNIITTISPNMFSSINRGLKELMIVDRIRVIEPKSLARFYNLKALILNGGEFSNLRPDIFVGLNLLAYLDLANNAIDTIVRGTFRALAQLRRLILHHNRISVIDSDTFLNLPIYQLDLSYNNLERIPYAVSCDLTKLEILNLRSNKIETVDDNIFQGCTQLQILNLNDNKIQHIKPNAFLASHIKSLYLRNNNINVLGHDSFFGLHVDELLDLMENNISKIEPLAFGNSKLKLVILCHHNKTQLARELRGRGLFLDMCNNFDNESENF